jgi:hypothetical protein
MYKIGAAGHPCLAERDIAKNFDMKSLANRMKPVLNKIIHTDQKGFVAGINISENNRMIDDIIEFVDNEDEEGVIIFIFLLPLRAVPHNWVV